MPQSSKAPDDGYFYHSIDLPGRPTIVGAWDLRENVQAYLGGIEVKGKKVLEVGAANGFVSFHLEKCGAQVVPFDLSPERLGDIMRYPGLDVVAFEAEYRAVVTGLNKAWWYAHEAFSSSLTLRHGTAYDIPEDLGPVDISTFGSILLHLRDPYSALASAARLTRERIVVTDVHNPPFRTTSRLDGIIRRLPANAASLARCNGMLFNPTLNQDPCTWWTFSAGAIHRLLTAVGFSRFTTSYHRQLFRPGFVPWGPTTTKQYQGPSVMAHLFTIVAERT
jgi:SAM-dependent methyltransferase